MSIETRNEPLAVVAPQTSPHRGGAVETRIMVYRALFMLVALLSTAQAQEDPCVGHDYAEAHCARPSACTADLYFRLTCFFARAADGECCAQGNYKKEGHTCAAALMPAYSAPRTHL